MSPCTVTREKKEGWRSHRGWVVGVACDEGGREKPFVEEMELTRPLDEPALDQRPRRGPANYNCAESTTAGATASRRNAPIEACMMALEGGREGGKMSRKSGAGER